MTQPDKPWCETLRERRDVIIFLTGKALDDAPVSLTGEWPTWRRVLWGMLRPFKFGEAYGRLMALHDAAKAIEAGQHEQLPSPPTDKEPVG